MAEAATRPTARKRTAAKAAPAAAAPKAAAVPTGATAEDGTVRIPLAMVHESDTKNYAKWVPPQGSGCVGALYVPLGTTEVKALLIGPAS